MAINRAASSTLRCAGCQRQALSAFLPSASALCRVSFSQFLVQSATLQNRALSSSPPRHLNVQLEDTRIEIESGHTQAEKRTDKITTHILTEPTPWYLQLQESQPESTNPFAARQRMPDLPPNPPPTLQPLLKYISMDLGLDYLSVIDLRTLDPPPALGAGLLMVFGSARSEKHLNVSADRLCRWLRSTYKLSPNADGLLGRNEIKLKLRRKARRSRMLGAAGAAEPTNPDDGITTGWICVNVGEVENGSPSELLQQGSETIGFVGFGRRIDGARIVVQMMTEEKRSDLDLEVFWQGVLDREGRKREGERRAWERLDQSTDESQHISRHATRTSVGAHQYQNEAQPTPVLRYRPGQVRGYHSSAKHYYANELRMESDKEQSPSEDDLEPHLLPSTKSRTRLEPSATNRFVKESLGTVIGDVPITSFDNVTAALALRTQMDYLKKLSISAARNQLGSGQRDKSSTTFLTTFYNSFPAFPTLEHWVCAIELQAFALKHAQPGYTRLHLIRMLRDMQASGDWIPRPVYMLALEVILLSPHQVEPKTNGSLNHDLDKLNAFRCSLGFAFEVIERMEAHGYDVKTENIFRLILDAISAAAAAETTLTEFPADRTDALADHDIDKLQHRFRRAVSLLYTPSAESDDPIHLALMQSCINTGHWNGFWDSWRSMAQMMKRRGPKMYLMLFSSVAQTQQQAHCQKVLMECIPELERESPLVPIEGELARAILECLVVAKVDGGVAPWKQIVERCRDGAGFQRT